MASIQSGNGRTAKKPYESGINANGQSGLSGLVICVIMVTIQSYTKKEHHGTNVSILYCFMGVILRAGE